MLVIDLTAECLDREYHGCGKAWAAVKNGKIVALRYMGEFAADRSGLPAWIRAVCNSATGLDDHMLPTARSSKALAAIAVAASACDDCPTPPRRARYRPAELLTMARAAIAAWDSASFGVYREKCRAELAEIGTIVSGTCSCTQFCCEKM